MGEPASRHGIDAFLKSEALFKMSAPRLIQSRALDVKLSIAPVVSMVSERIY
jgi:hypothetical protein